MDPVRAVLEIHIILTVAFPPGEVNQDSERLKEHPMRAVDLIRKKREGLSLSEAEIATFVTAATTGAWPDYQLSAMLMAIVCRGMSAAETSALTAAMAHSGSILTLDDLPGRKVDKHSTGGVGDKTSLILAPLAAACGVIVPMMAGRGLGHTGGTYDKLKAIPGFHLGLTQEAFHRALHRVGCAIMGQTAEFAPADRILYALRDVTGTVESLPLICSSIMSKKLAEGIDALVLDVKCGCGAFMKDRSSALELARSLFAIGTAQGLQIEALVTDMNQPLGRAVGNALEVREALDTLRGRGPRDVQDLSVQLAARMVRLAGKAASLGDAEAQVLDALHSGRGLERLRAIVTEQGGDPHCLDDSRLLPTASHRHLVTATCPGFVTEVHAERIGKATMLLGAGRERVQDPIDPAVGALLAVKVGDEIPVGAPLVEIHYNDPQRLQAALPLLTDAFRVEPTPPPLPSLILDILE